MTVNELFEELGMKTENIPSAANKFDEEARKIIEEYKN